MSSFGACLPSLCTTALRLFQAVKYTFPFYCWVLFHDRDAPQFISPCLLMIMQVVFSLGLFVYKTCENKSNHLSWKGLTRSHGRYMFNFFKESVKMFPKCLCHLYLTPTIIMHESFNSSVSWATLWTVSFMLDIPAVDSDTLLLFKLAFC